MSDSVSSESGGKPHKHAVLEKSTALAPNPLREDKRGGYKYNCSASVPIVTGEVLLCSVNSVTTRKQVKRLVLNYQNC